MIVVAAFYRFININDVVDLQKKLLDLTKEKKILGTILVAKEGINATVSGSREAIDCLKKFLYEKFDYLEYKESFYDKNPFYRLKVKIKKEILNIGSKLCQPQNIVGSYVNAQDWDKLLLQGDVTVIDVRNDYEVAIGKFVNAIDPKTRTFSEFAQFVKNNLDPKKHKKIAMSCTGGIRCEVASSFMKMAGFDEVYHLKGGVLQYLEDTKGKSDLWQGECFVFDQRVTVNKNLQKGDFELCFACRYPLTPQDKALSSYEEGVSCEKCFNQTNSEQKKRYQDRQKQVDLFKNKGLCHLGPQEKY